MKMMRKHLFLYSIAVFFITLSVFTTLAKHSISPHEALVFARSMRAISVAGGASLGVLGDGSPSQTRALLGDIGRARKKDMYMIVIDAGSSGTRIHVYKLGWVEGRKFPLVELPNKKLKMEPGLSTFLGREADAGASLEPLIKFANKSIPAAFHASVPVILSATAGLRMLPKHSADLILDSCCAYLSDHSPFLVQRKDIKVISGRDEGAFAWLGMNFLLGRLHGMPEEAKGMLGVIEVGGASAQVTFMPYGENDESEHTYVVQLGPDRYPLYTHSYLGFGQDEARRRVNEALADVGVDPCLQKGFKRPDGDYDVYYGKEHGAFEGGGEFDLCSKYVYALMDKEAECSSAPCTFQGVHQPAFPARKGWGLVLIGNYYHTWRRVSKTVNITPARMEKAGQKLCSTPYADLLKQGITSPYPDAEQWSKPSLCFSLAYLSSFLQRGLNMRPDAEAFAMGKVGETEIEWALGEMLSFAMNEGESGGRQYDSGGLGSESSSWRNFIGFFTTTEIFVVLLATITVTFIFAFALNRYKNSAGDVEIGGMVPMNDLSKDQHV